MTAPSYLPSPLTMNLRLSNRCRLVKIAHFGWYVVITLLSEPTIATLHVIRTIKPNERARLGMPAPQTPTTLAPGAQ